MKIKWGFKSKNLHKGLVSLISALTLCLFHSNSIAQTVAPTSAPSSVNTGSSDSGTSTSVKATKPRSSKAKNIDPASDTIEGTKKKSSNQAIAQGLSISETLGAKESPWGFSLTTQASRGVDEYADDVQSSNYLDVTYRLTPKSALTLSLGYSTLLYKRGGELFNNRDSDPSQYGMNDTSLSYVLPSVWHDRYNRLLISTSLTAPTSRTSNRISMNGSLSSTVILRYTPRPGIIISPNIGIYARSFRYDTVNAAGSTATNGFSFNSPLGLSYGLSGSYVFKPWLIGSVAYSQTQRYDYNNDIRMIQALSTQVSISTNEGLNIFLGYVWRDQATTNEPLFAAIKTSLYTGVGYAF
jgi:hypothetical protein